MYIEVKLALEAEGHLVKLSVPAVSESENLIGYVDATSVTSHRQAVDVAAERYIVETMLARRALRGRDCPNEREAQTFERRPHFCFSRWKIRM